MKNNKINLSISAFLLILILTSITIICSVTGGIGAGSADLTPLPTSTETIIEEPTKEVVKKSQDEEIPTREAPTENPSPTYTRVIENTSMPTEEPTETPSPTLTPLPTETSTPTIQPTIETVVICDINGGETVVEIIPTLALVVVPVEENNPEVKEPEEETAAFDYPAPEEVPSGYPAPIVGGGPEDVPERPPAATSTPSG